MPRGPRKYGPQQAKNSSVQPKRAPTGLPQGENKALMDAQAQVPLPDSAGRLQMAMDMAGGAPLGGGDMLAQPTAMPDQPVTEGLPMGAGLGPEAIETPMPPVQVDDERMARVLPMLEALADRPDTSDQLRNYVRRVRGSLPPQVTMASITKEPPR